MPKKKIEKPAVIETTIPEGKEDTGASVPDTPDLSDSQEDAVIRALDTHDLFDNAEDAAGASLDGSDLPGHAEDADVPASDNADFSDAGIPPEAPEDVGGEAAADAPPDTGPDATAEETAATLEPPAQSDMEEHALPESLMEITAEEVADISGEPETKPPEEPEPPKDSKPTRVRKKADAPPEQSAEAPEPKPVPARKKTIYDLKLNALDRDLSPEEKQEWSAIYASYRSKSILTGTVIGTDQNTFDIKNRETGEMETKTLSSLIIIDYRVKVLIPESEMWMPGEERPSYVLRNMTGSEIDYVILEVDREGECAIGSRRMALAARRHFFATARNGHNEGDLLKCRVIATGPQKCTVECNGYDIQLSQRDLNYTTIPDLREKYHPGQELSCRLKAYDREAARLVISVKEASPNPFIGADKRHPVGSRRQAVISGKYAGGVFCTLPDDTVCLCLYSARHSDMDFGIGDSIILVIRQYDYGRQLIYGRILAKW